MEYQRTCPVCGRQFTSTRRDALCCSSTCRSRKLRETRYANDEQKIVEQLRMALPRPQKPRPATTENIAEVLTELKGCTTALRYFSRSCSPSIRTRLIILSDCIDEAIKGVGL